MSMIWFGYLNNQQINKEISLMIYHQYHQILCCNMILVILTISYMFMDCMNGVNTSNANSNSNNDLLVLVMGYDEWNRYWGPQKDRNRVSRMLVWWCVKKGSFIIPRFQLVLCILGLLLEDIIGYNEWDT